MAARGRTSDCSVEFLGGRQGVAAPSSIYPIVQLFSANDEECVLNTRVTLTIENLRHHRLRGVDGNTVSKRLRGYHVRGGKMVEVGFEWANWCGHARRVIFHWHVAYRAKPPGRLIAPQALDQIGGRPVCTRPHRRSILIFTSAGQVPVYG
jgi:hypothetical protein